MMGEVEDCSRYAIIEAFTADGTRMHSSSYARDGTELIVLASGRRVFLRVRVVGGGQHKDGVPMLHL